MAIDETDIEHIIARSRALQAEARHKLSIAKAHAEDVRQMLAASATLLAKQKQRRIPDRDKPMTYRPTPPPDALCALFDALHEAVHQAEAHGDPDLFALAERAFLRVGEKIEETAATMARHQGFAQ